MASVTVLEAQKCVNCKKIPVIFGLSLFVLISLNDTLWSPFLPTEFKHRDFSESATGIIISANDVLTLITSIFFPIFKNVKYRRFTFCLGSFCQGVLSVIFGQLMAVKSATLFAVLCICVRALIGVTTGVIWCSGSALLLSMFPKDTGKIIRDLLLFL